MNEDSLDTGARRLAINSSQAADASRGMRPA